MPRYSVDKNIRTSIRFTAEQRNLIAERMPKYGADRRGLELFTKMAVAQALEDWAGE